MSFTISLTEAQAMTSRYRSERNTILAEEYREQNILLNCETFDRSAFDDLLALPTCESIRIYFGMLEDYQVRAIVVAVDGNDDDILPNGENDATIVENGRPCPDLCPTNLL